MGISQTPNLGLLIPNDSEFVSNTPEIIKTNADKFDSVIGAGALGIQTYTPVLSFTSGATPPVLGPDGLILGWWFSILDIVFCWGRFQFGSSGVTVNTGTFQISLPIPSADIHFSSGTAGEGHAIGEGIIRDDSPSTKSHGVTCQLTSADTIFFLTEANNTGRAATEAVPMTWTINDRLSWLVKYHAAI